VLTNFNSFKNGINKLEAKNLFTIKCKECMHKKECGEYAQKRYSNSMCTWPSKDAYLHIDEFINKLKKDIK